MLESQRIHLRLFLEGVEVPVISASVSASVGAAASATIQIPGHDSALYILPKTIVHIFFYDWEQAHFVGNRHGPVTDRVGRTVNTPQKFFNKKTKKEQLTSSTLKDLNYKLLFVGEVISVNFAKDGFGSQTITLACSDCSSVLDTAFLFQTQYHSSTAGLIDQDGGFYGGNENPFDDMISQPEMVVANFIKQNSPKNPCLAGNPKSIVGGLFSFLEVLLGVHGYSYGLDSFYTIQERRLRLMEQIASDSGKVAANLFDGAVFEKWVSGRLGNSPAVMSFREVSQLVLNYVFYNQVPNPVAYYKWGERELPEYATAGNPETFEARAAEMSKKGKENYLKLDAQFAEAANALLQEVDAIPITLVISEESTSISKEAFTSAYFTTTFRDYAKRAEINDISVDEAKKVAPGYAHDNGLAVDITSGLAEAWSVRGMPRYSSLRKNVSATWWGFLGVANKSSGYWKGKRLATGFRALMYFIKKTKYVFSPDPRDLKIAIELKLDAVFEYLEGYTIEEGKSIPETLADLAETEDKIVADYDTVDFWILKADPEADTKLEGAKLALELTFIVVEEQIAWYKTLGTAVENVNATGAYTNLNWGGGWYSDKESNKIAKFLKSYGVGWDPVHVEDSRFDKGLISRDPKALNDDWENRLTYENYTPSVQDILEGATKGATKEEVSGGGGDSAKVAKDPLKEVYKRSASNADKRGRERLITQLYRPDIWFCPQPMCNNIFPEEYSSLTFSRPMMREITRLKLTSYHQLMEDVVVNKYYFAPQFKGATNLEEKGIGTVAKVVLYPHEVYTGIIPKIQKLSEASFYTKGSEDLRSEVEGLGDKVDYEDGSTSDTDTPDKLGEVLAMYGAKVAHFHLLTARYASRSGSLLGRFMPRLVAGFPAGIYQKTYNNRGSISTALASGLSGYTGSNSNEIFNQTKPIHYQCMIQSVTHTISQQQANTSVSFTHARAHKTSSTTDDLLSAMAESDGGFSVDTKLGSDIAENAVEDNIDTGSSKVYIAGTAFFEIVKELYLVLFEEEKYTFNTARDFRYPRSKLNLYQGNNVDTLAAQKQLKETASSMTEEQIKDVCLDRRTNLNVAEYYYPEKFRQGNPGSSVDTYSDRFNIGPLYITGIPLGDKVFSADESDITIDVGSDKLLSAKVTGTFESKASWETQVYLRIPIDEASPYVEGIVEKWSSDDGPRLSFTYLEAEFKNMPDLDLESNFDSFISEEGAAIVTGPVLGTNGESAVMWEVTSNKYDDDGAVITGFSGYLYIKLRPKFTQLELVYGTLTEAEKSKAEAEDTGTQLPWEMKIRPGWISGDSYANKTIGETYKEMMGCGSIISHFSDRGSGLSPLPGFSEVSTEQAMDKLLADYQVKASAESPIRWIYKTCRRGDANLVEVMGKKESGSENDYSDSGGFHSAAYGPYSNLESLDIVGKSLQSLLDPTKKKIQINADTNNLDPRQSRRNAILYYLSTILSRGIRS